MKNPIEKFSLDIFIPGENIDLCIPDDNFARNSSWYSWFNDFKTTRFLEQGGFPNTPESQASFFAGLKNSNRLSLIISDKEQYIGTISLSFINLNKRTADIALLLGEPSNNPNADLLALEAMALISAHGFDKLGLNRISAGQHVKLLKWQRKMEVIGYRLEGIKTNGFIKASEVADAVSISLLRDDYQLIVGNRRKLWDSSEKIRARLSKMPSNSFAEKLKKFLTEEGGTYYDTIFNL